MTYKELTSSLLKFKQTIRLYEEQLVGISIGLIEENPTMWLENDEIGYGDKKLELEFRLDYYNKNNNTTKYNFVLELQQKLYDAN